MGAFEDLLQRVREGDLEALDELEQNYSGSTLREKAENADRYKAIADKAMPVLRQQRVAELAERLPEELRTFASAEDFSDVDPEAITLEALQDSANTKSQAEQTRRLATAKEAGFETVEEYEEALNAVKQRKQERREGMESLGAAATSGGGDPSESLESDTFTKGKEAFEAAKREGRADDHAMANAIDSILETQLVELDTE